MNSNDNNNTTAIPSAILHGFESALIGKTSCGSNVYDMDLIIKKMLIDSGNEDFCDGPDVLEDDQVDPYMDALDQFWYDMSYYKLDAEKEIPFIIIDGLSIAWPQYDNDDLPF